MWDSLPLTPRLLTVNSLRSTFVSPTSREKRARYGAPIVRGGGRNKRLKTVRTERRIMTEDTMVAPAPAASPAPSSAPASAPVAAPVAAPPAASSVDPGKFPIREDYAAALLTEKLGAIAPPEEPAAEPEAPAVEPVEVTAAPPEEEDFSLEVETIVTPEVLSQMVTDNPGLRQIAGSGRPPERTTL